LSLKRFWGTSRYQTTFRYTRHDPKCTSCREKKLPQTYD